MQKLNQVFLVPIYTYAENFIVFHATVFEIFITDRHTLRHINAHTESDEDINLFGRGKKKRRKDAGRLHA